MITLYRIDDRLVHGQTMIKLLPNYPCDGIIIVNDEIAKNADRIISIVDGYTKEIIHNK